MHVLIEREICDKPLESAAFVFLLPQAAQLAHAQVGVLLLLGVERGVTFLGDVNFANRRGCWRVR